MSGERRFRVTVFQGGEQIDRFVFQKNVVTIGRSPESDVRIPSKTVSRKQAELLRTSQGFALFAHKSTNVTKVRGEEVPPEGSKPLAPGDPIRIADSFDLTLEVLDEAGAPIPPPASGEDDDGEGPTPIAGSAAAPVVGPADDPTDEVPRVPERATASTQAAPAKTPSAPPSQRMRKPAAPVKTPSARPSQRMRKPAAPKTASAKRSPPQRDRPTRQRPARPTPPPPAQPAGGGSILGATHGAPVPIPPPVKVEVVASARQRQGPAGARLLCRMNGSERALEVHDDFYVGGGEDNDLCLSGGYAPRRAALVVRVAGRYRVYNTSPLPETVLVNGKGIEGHADLVDGDELKVYGVGLTFESS